MKAPSMFDVRHSMLVTYSLPLRVPVKLLSGWTISGTTVFHTGTPFTVETGSDAPPLGNVDGEWQDRPSILDPSILNKTIDRPDTSQSILRRSAFSADDTFLKGRGNIGRNTFRKQGVANFNMALTRTFQFNDKAKAIALRAEALNLTNHPQFDAPNSTFASPSFGQITNTLNAGRVPQFGLNARFWAVTLSTVSTPEIDQRIDEEREKLYHVLILNDEEHTFEYVIEMLQAVFGFPYETAMAHTLEAHNTGSSVVWTCGLTEAENRRDQIHAYGPDWRMPNSRGPVSALVEPA